MKDHPLWEAFVRAANVACVSLECREDWESSFELFVAGAVAGGSSGGFRVALPGVGKYVFCASGSRIETVETAGAAEIFTLGTALAIQKSLGAVVTVLEKAS